MQLHTIVGTFKRIRELLFPKLRFVKINYSWFICLSMKIKKTVGYSISLISRENLGNKELVGQRKHKKYTNKPSHTRGNNIRRKYNKKETIDKF